MFTVGDRKQAIFGFQGTEPAAFEAARIRFGERAVAGGRPFEDVDLDTNYRSSPAVLDVVDAWIAAGAPELMGLASDEPRSEERRVGKEGGSTGRSRWWPYH